MLRRLTLAALAGLALLLAACGGGGGEKASPTPSVSATPTPPTVAVPVLPADFAAYPDAIAAYLTEAQGDATCLAELFAAWQMPEPTFGPPCAAADLDGDGRDEYVVRIADRATTGPPLGATVPATAEPASYGGDIIILDDSGGGYEVVYRASVRGAGLQLTEGLLNLLNPTIIGTGDYNDDGKAEAAFAGSECGASTCMTSVFVVGWDGTQYSDFFAEPVSQPGTEPSEISFEDTDGDGAQEIRIPAGTISSVGAGPQRGSVLTYDWDGTSFVLTNTRYVASDYLYFAVVDADAAYAAGNPAGAVALYRKAAEDTSLKDWKEELGTGARDRDELVPYARFRLYLTQLILLPTTAMDSALTLVGSIEALAQEFPDSLHAQAAQSFGDAYRRQQTPEASYTAGCVAFTSFLEQRRSEFDAAWDYGYANPTRQPDELCPR
jgi:hypothetical protein